MTKPKFRRPAPKEQVVLDHLTVRPITAHERPRYQALMEQHHYLHSHQLVGEQLCYVATHRGQWLALSSWCAAARYLKARDSYIGWSPEQCRKRRALLANNARFLILPEAHYPNLASRVMKQLLQRLSGDWEARFHHPIVLVESFVDPDQFRGTTYRCSGWSQLGLTQGYGRHAKDYYIHHEQPKQLWVKALIKKAPKLLHAPRLPEAWAVVESKVRLRCTAPSAELKSLCDHLAKIPEYRSRNSLGYPLAGMLTLIAVAVFCGVVRGKKDLAHFARTLSQSQLRALRFRREPRSGRIRCPGVTTFFRILNQVDEQALELALLAWQEQVLGPVQDRIIAVDGKALRHSQGGELVSAIGAETARWLGSVRTPDKTNEITAARTLLERIDSRQDLSGKVVVLDALHTNQETARLIVQELGADYLFTIKTNQETLHKTVHGLLGARAFSPPDPARSALRQEHNRGRQERRQLRLQDTTPEQACFVGAAQIGELQSRMVSRNGKASSKFWAMITSADLKVCSATNLLGCRRKYWEIEASHQRLDMSLGEDRSRVRTPRALTVLGMFRRLTISLACAWLNHPQRRKQKSSTVDFQARLRAEGARRAFSLATSRTPKAWNDA